MAWVVLSGYLLGSIPFPLIISRLVAGLDLRDHGTGNMGARNASRLLGKGWSLVILLLDAIKGASAAWLGAALAGEPLLGGAAAVAGHIWPLFAGFRGGKGLAASLGALALANPPLLAVTAVAILPFWALTRNMYVGVAAASTLLPALCWWRIGTAPAVASASVWALMVLWTHYGDIRRWWGSRTP